MIIIKNEFQALDKKIKKIKEKGLIAVPNLGSGSVGLLFEKELGLNNNDFAVSDIDGIELKVTKKASCYPISLFSCTCDGPEFFELNRLVDKFGVYDPEYKNTKILYIRLSAKNFTNWGKYLKMKLVVDYKQKKLYIMVAHTNGKVIEKRAFWDFDTLDKSLERKLRYLCYVTYRTSYINKKKYCSFDDVYYLENEGFMRFLELIESGDIFVYIKYGVYKSGCKAGRSYNHGTAFQIKKSSLFCLFKRFKS